MIVGNPNRASGTPALLATTMLASALACSAQPAMAEEPELHCFMSGITHQVYAQFGFQLLQTPDGISWINEFMGSTRHIATDGRDHLHPNIKLFNGDSVAQWEGDTLVIDTTNQNGRTWLDVNGSFTTPNLHVVERLTMTDANTIQWEATLTDPTIYTQPYFT